MIRNEIIILTDYPNRYYTGLSDSYSRAFENKGYKCLPVNFNVNPRLCVLLGTLSQSLLKKYLSYHQEHVKKAILSLKAKHVFVIKGFYLLPETIRELRDAGKMVFCFYPDDPFSENVRSSSNNFVKESILSYDHYFIWSRNLAERIKYLSHQSVYYLPFAADPRIIHPVNANKSLVDFSFIGNADEERLNNVSKIFNLMSETCYQGLLFGEGWEKTFKKNTKGLVENVKFLETICSSKVNLNILRLQNKNSHNMRTFEIPAAGGFMLHEHSDEAADFFKKGEEAEFFNDAEECSDKIIFYLKNDSLRDSISTKGFQKIFSAKHTYEDRVDTILKVVTKQ
jgi:spore maturation protein CgeB